MTIMIDFSPSTLEQLKAEADSVGKDIQTVVREAVEARLARRNRTITEALEPIHDAIEASGMSEEAVDALFEAELKAVRAERRASSVKP